MSKLIKEDREIYLINCDMSTPRVLSWVYSDNRMQPVTTGWDTSCVGYFICDNQTFCNWMMVPIHEEELENDLNPLSPDEIDSLVENLIRVLEPATITRLANLQDKIISNGNFKVVNTGG